MAGELFADPEKRVYPRTVYHRRRPVALQPARPVAIVVYPRNATVTLNTGEVGVVVGINPQAPTRPQVQILFDAAGQPTGSQQVVDLLASLTTFIVAVEYDKQSEGKPTQE